jgi:hypothetical protein
MENKFKVWDKKLNVMWQEIELTKLLSYLIFQIMPNADAYLALKDHFTEMVWLRWVGLKDKTGTEIYEGDILDIGKATPATLEWCEGAYELLIEGKFECRLCVQDIKEVKIIGNIYANPELLVQPPVSNVK